MYICYSHISQPALNVGHQRTDCWTESPRVGLCNLCFWKAPIWFWYNRSLDRFGNYCINSSSLQTVSFLARWGATTDPLVSPNTSTELAQTRCSLHIYSNWITRKGEVVITSRLFPWILFFFNLWYLVATFLNQLQGSLEERWPWRAEKGMVAKSHIATWNK